jgi:hypothetical protein
LRPLSKPFKTNVKFILTLIHSLDMNLGRFSL